MVKLLILMILLVFNFKSNISVDSIDYKDILANVDDYEYPYNHINK